MRGMSGSPVNLSSGLPETILPAEAPAVTDALAQALALEGPARRTAVTAVVESNPRSLDGWAALGDLARDRIEAYACYRVGYHRGLDTLRANGWRGSGYVRWRHESNRGFLRALDGLGRMATEIGEGDEAARCADFVRQLDPDWDRRG
ncbi:MAG: DUF3151 domain-containing protein [Acidimicrobiales bacterium]